LSIDHAHPTI